MPRWLRPLHPRPPSHRRRQPRPHPRRRPGFGLHDGRRNPLPDRNAGKGVTAKIGQRLRLRCGLRVSAVRNVRWKAIAWAQGTLRVHNRKGPVDRMVSLSPDGATALRQSHGLRSAGIGNIHASVGCASPHAHSPYRCLRGKYKQHAHAASASRRQPPFAGDDGDVPQRVQAERGATRSGQAAQGGGGQCRYPPPSQGEGSM